MFTNVMLFIVLAWAIFFDLRERRIPNWLILTSFIIAFSYAFYIGDFPGLIDSLKGAGLGMLLLIIPFAAGGMGAGDLKLLSVVGAVKGSFFVINTFLWMAIWGGLIAIVILIWQKKLSLTLNNIILGFNLSVLRAAKFSDILSKDAFHLYLPYALAIGLGALTSLFKGWWGL